MLEEADVKSAVETLAKDAVASIKNTGAGLEPFRGKIALHDPMSDERFATMASFAKVAEVLDAMPRFREQCGTENTNRVTLQFIYALCGALPEAAWDQNAFEKVWASFLTELSQDEWTYIGLSNLQNFRSDSLLLDLGDGVTIRGRSFEELGRILNWRKWDSDRLAQDWQDGAASSYVLIVEHKVRKTPGNLILWHSFMLTVKALRVLLALRLFKSGEIRMGRMFMFRPAAFDFGIGGGSSAGFTLWNPGTDYHLEAHEAASVRALYEMLGRFETTHKPQMRNLDVALRRFSSIYERYMHQSEDEILDAVTALEAMIGTEMEISFRISFRSAGILAADDDERVRIFDLVKAYYDTRSRIVHGGELKEKHNTLIRNREALISIVRRLLVAFLHLLESGSEFTPKRLRDELDRILQHSERRQELRKAMGLT